MYKIGTKMPPSALHLLDDWVPEDLKSDVILYLMREFRRHTREGRDLETSWRQVSIPPSLTYFRTRLPDRTVVDLNVFRSYYEPLHRTPDSAWVTRAMQGALVRIVDMAADLYDSDPKWSRWNLAATVARLLDYEMAEENEPEIQLPLVSALSRLPPTKTRHVLDAVVHLYDDDTGNRNISSAGSAFLDRIERDVDASRALLLQRSKRAAPSEDEWHRRLETVGRRMSLAPSPKLKARNSSVRAVMRS
jgi:hypothetical protein